MCNGPLQKRGRDREGVLKLKDIIGPGKKRILAD